MHTPSVRNWSMHTNTIAKERCETDTVWDFLLRCDCGKSSFKHHCRRKVDFFDESKFLRFGGCDFVLWFRWISVTLINSKSGHFGDAKTAWRSTRSESLVTAFGAGFLPAAVNLRDVFLALFSSDRGTMTLGFSELRWTNYFIVSSQSGASGSLSSSFICWHETLRQEYLTFFRRQNTLSFLSSRRFEVVQRGERKWYREDLSTQSGRLLAHCESDYLLFYDVLAQDKVSVIACQAFEDDVFTKAFADACDLPYSLLNDRGLWLWC